MSCLAQPFDQHIPMARIDQPLRFGRHHFSHLGLRRLAALVERDGHLAHSSGKLARVSS
jgi:hypothetical protein